MRIDDLWNWLKRFYSVLMQRREDGLLCINSMRFLLFGAINVDRVIADFKQDNSQHVKLHA